MLSPESHQAAAVCTRAQAERLLRYDHHYVQVENRWGIMLTYPWHPLEEAREPFLLKVVFNPDPKHFRSAAEIRGIIFKHPQAPQEIQRIIDQLEFKDAAE